MATEKESTLEIKDFHGISRYLSSPNQDPNKFRTLQNLWEPNRGEASLVPGILLQGQNIPGVDKILHLNSNLDTAAVTGGFVILYKYLQQNIPLPSGMHFNPLGGAGGPSLKVSLEYVYAGTRSQQVFSTETVHAFGLGGLQVTMPTNVPDFIHAINVWVERANGTDQFVWGGAFYRRLGSFVAPGPPGITILAPSTSYTGAIPVTGVPGAMPIEDTPSSLTVNFGTGGTLQGGNTYYLAIVPAVPRTNVSGRYSFTTADLADASVRFFNVVVPPGKTTMTVKFNGLSGLVDGVAYDKSIVLMGQTPEDMLPVGAEELGTTGPVLLSTVQAGLQINECPYNGNMTLTMCNGETSSAMNGEAFPNRVSAAFMYQDQDLVNNSGQEQDPSQYVGCASIQLPYAASTHRECLGSAFSGPTIRSQFLNGAFVKNQTNFLVVKSSDFDFPNYDRVSSRQYLDRVYFCDGNNPLFYTNGVVMCSAIKDAGTQDIPITRFLEIFKDRFVLAGGQANFANTRGGVFYSDIPGSGTSLYGFGTTSLNFLSAEYGGGSPIVGLGVFSQNLSTGGPQNFLVVGKTDKSFSWNGGTDAASADLIELGRNAAWTSKRSMCLTTQGSVLVGRTNVFLLNGADLTPIGDDIKAILQAIPEGCLPLVNVYFRKDRVVVGYTNNDALPLVVDRELWCDFRHAPDGSLEYVWTGPHVLTPYTSVTSVPIYGASRDFVVSANADKLYQRMAPVTTDNGALIPIVIDTQDLALGADAFLKVLSRLYLRCKINRQETLTVVFTVIDNGRVGQGGDSSASGDTTFTETFQLPYTGPGEVYRLFQKIFSSRYTGSLIRVTISFSTNVNFTLNLMSLLFNNKKRRLL